MDKKAKEKVIEVFSELERKEQKSLDIPLPTTTMNCCMLFLGWKWWRENVYILDCH